MPENSGESRNEDRGRNRSGRVVRLPRSECGDRLSTGVPNVAATQAGGVAASTEDMGEGTGEASPGADTVSTNATNISIWPLRLGNSRHFPHMPLMDIRQIKVCISHLRRHIPALAPTTLAGMRRTNIHPSHLPLRCTRLSLNPFRNFRSLSIPPGIIYSDSLNIT